MKSHINKKYDLNELFFRSIDSPEKAYFLGLMMSDGTVNDRSIVITLQEKDISILIKLRNLIEYTGPVSKRIIANENHQNICTLRIYSRELVKDLIDLGCNRRKTYNMSFPKIDPIYYSHFIRGYFDGDGCIIKKNIGYYFSITGNRQFLHELNSILEQDVNIDPCKISRKNKSSELFGAIQYTKNSDLIKLRNYLYKNCNNLYIERKYDKFFEIEEKLPKVCKICSKPHEAKGYCKTCYHREVFYKKKILTQESS